LHHPVDIEIEVCDQSYAPWLCYIADKAYHNNLQGDTLTHTKLILRRLCASFAPGQPGVGCPMLFMVSGEPELMSFCFIRRSYWQNCRQDIFSRSRPS